MAHNEGAVFSTMSVGITQNPLNRLKKSVEFIRFIRYRHLLWKNLGATDFI